VRTLVVDASVVGKWFPPLDQEPLADRAYSLLASWKGGGFRLIAPDLIWVEIANVLGKSVRQNRCSRGVAETTLALFRSQNLPTLPASPFMDQALAIAMTHGRTVYDSLYLALAVDSGADLVTADEKLVSALAKQFPVKWLGAI
jgi:predicted nucleic acid-binding protein